MVQPKTERHIVIWEYQVFYFCLRWSLSGENPPNPLIRLKINRTIWKNQVQITFMLGLEIKFCTSATFSFGTLNHDQFRFFSTFLLHPYQWILEKIRNAGPSLSVFCGNNKSATFHHLYMKPCFGVFRKSRSVMVPKNDIYFCSARHICHAPFDLNIIR